MKRNLLNGLLFMLVSLFATTAKAQSTQIASWTFETGYDVAENVYTPNANAWAAVGAQWFNAGQPKFVANEAIGNAADYIVTGSTARYWELCTGWENKVFRIVNDTEANNITDYTDGSKHANYYEVQFPAKGYTGIKLEYACAFGGNAEATLQAVVSTDNGSTWVVAGSKCYGFYMVDI